LLVVQWFVGKADKVVEQSFALGVHGRNRTSLNFELRAGPTERLQK
jgi:hypothetical protein